MARVHNKNPELLKFEFAKIGVGTFSKNIFWWQNRIWEISKTAENRECNLKGICKFLEYIFKESNLIIPKYCSYDV